MALLTALASLYTQRRVRHTVAMTGEITLRGLVLPVGGIKEKVLAAKRAGIQTVLLPEKNQKDIEEIKPETLAGLDIVYVRRVDEVLARALEAEPMRDPAEVYCVPETERPVPNGTSADVLTG